MPHLKFMTIALVLSLFAPAALAQDAAAGQAIHRCIGAHGEIVFSGLACAAGTTANGPGAVSGSPASTVCPTSRAELDDRVGAAIAARDPNALAGLLRWQGIGARAANQRLRALRDLAKRPLLGIDGRDALNSAGAADVDATGDALRVRTGSNEEGGVREHDFGVRSKGACYWLVW